MSSELWTVIIDVGVSVAIEVVTLWVAPDYQALAHTVVAGLQAVAVGFVMEFRGQRKIEALAAQIKTLANRR